MRKIHYILLSVLIGLIGTGMHFFHHIEVSEHAWEVLCHFLPTGETCWEHLKLILYPMIVLGVILWIKNKTIKSFGGAILATTITIPLAIVLYYVFDWITPEGDFIHDIVLYWVEIFFAVWLALRWSHNERIGRLWPLWIGVTAAWIMAFYILTFHYPQNCSLFQVPEAWSASHPDSEQLEHHHHHDHGHDHDHDNGYGHEHQ